MTAMDRWHEEIAAALNAAPTPDSQARDAAQARQAMLTKPAGSLGRLEELALWMAALQGREKPEITAPRAILFAGNHGVAGRGVSAYPADVTAQMVRNFEAGGAAINQLCTLHGIDLTIIEMRLETPSGDIVTEPALSPEACRDAFERGRKSIAEKPADLLLLGEMGIGNTTAAAALCAALLGGGGDWAGRGTGLDDAGLAAKAAVIDHALNRFRKTGEGGPLAALRHLGGYEIAALSGAILEARLRLIPVLLDGFTVTAAAAVLFAIDNRALQHCRAAHLSAEHSHGRLLQMLDLLPLLDLDLRLGEASGAALAYPLLQAALAAHNGMATFAEAAVDRRPDA